MASLAIVAIAKGSFVLEKRHLLEARDEDEDFPARANRSSNNDLPVGADTSRKRQPTSLLSRRFLRPEEEEELRHLRTSIGLAKDWMAKNSHA